MMMGDLGVLFTKECSLNWPQSILISDLEPPVGRLLAFEKDL